MLMRHYEIFF